MVCDDDEAVRSSLSFMLKKSGYEVTCALKPEDILKDIRGNDFSLVLLDMNFSLSINGEEGIELLQKIRLLKPGIPVILITAWGSVELAVRGIKLGASDFVTKPWNNLQLLRKIETTITLNTKQNQDNSGIEEEEDLSEFHGVIGKDPGLLEILSIIKRVAPTHAPVLIMGESGTGKELIATEIHRLSQRMTKPFIKVNLGGIPSGLFESEMFGFRKGAFTDAKRNHTGRFEKANKGTIFLDEIGDLDHASQVKLLRVLQDQTFEPLGDTNSITVDVRIISATNRNLNSLVEKGLFREDLLYRINLIKIEVPPLRKRRKDIPVLADYFIELAAGNYSMQMKTISDEAKEWLSNQSWPGNVRELKNFVERTLLLTSHDPIRSEDFIVAKSVGSLGDAGISQVEHPPVTLTDMERALIIKTVEECGGNLLKTSEKLGIGRATLYRKMERYGIRIKRNE